MSNKQHTQTAGKFDYGNLGIVLGMLLGTSIGLVLWQVTGRFSYFPIFTGAGLSIGVSVGIALDRQQRDNE